MTRSVLLSALLLLLAGCAPDTETACGDGIDEDKDGATDCDDSDCEGSSACVDDADGDRYNEDEGDCDDANPDINPAADEVCDGIDNDCDGLTDDQDPGTQDKPVWYRDADSDGWGLEDDTERACEQPSGHAELAGDCDDTQAGAFPGAAEAESDTICMLDADDDGYGSDEAIAPTERGTDCDDSDPGSNPGEEEIWYDGVDQNCAGWSDYDQDDDHDEAEGMGGSDCDDLDPGTYSFDYDKDGWSPCDGDCDDENDAIRPEVFELFDGVDNDCDGDVDFLDLARAEAAIDGLGDGDGAGWALAPFADVDGDGNDDFLVAARGSDSGGTDAGAIYLVAGSSEGELALDGALAVLTGESDDDMVADVVQPAGDVNGDGVEDLVVGASQADWRGTEAGAAYLVLGPVTDSLSLADADRRFGGETIHDLAGWGLAAGGDVDGDGRDDLLIGAPQGETAAMGAAYLVLDAASSTDSMGLENADWVLRGLARGDQAGMAVELSADLNADGLHDLVVGAPAADDTGALYVLFGSETPAGSLADADVTLLGEASGDEAGTAAVHVGDVDFDGHQDLLVGAPGNDEAGTDAGSAYLLLGPVSALGDLASGGAVLRGEAEGDGVGSVLGLAGDINADNYDDMLLGAPGASTDAGTTGKAWLVLGPTWGESSLADADGNYHGEAGGDAAGTAVSGAGDTNGDGFDDFLIGAPGHDAAATDAGAVYLVIGRGE